LIALRILQRLASAEQKSSAPASQCARLLDGLDLGRKGDRTAFREICVDWLAGRRGPVKEASIRGSMAQDQMTDIMLAALEHSTYLQAELQRQAKEVNRLQKSILRLRDQMEQSERSNQMLRRFSRRASAAISTPIVRLRRFFSRRTA
jgi:hypothetical protein